MDPIKFTPTETRLLMVLNDGQAHTLDELFACLEDELQDKSNVNVHISRMRPKMKPHGHDILCVYRRGSFLYQHVLLIHPDE